MLALGIASFSQLTINTPYYFIYVCLIVTGLGMGVAFSSLNSGMVKTIKAEESGIASSIFLLFALLGNTFGVVISTIIYETTAVTSLIHSLYNKTQPSMQQIIQLQSVVHYVGRKTHNLSAFSISGQHKVLSLIPYSLNAGITKALLVTTAGVLIASILVACFTKRETEAYE
jgi:predicted PurR-regulated permease PerM